MELNIDQIELNIDHGNVNAVMFLDPKKAFDTVDHEILLGKLNAYGISGMAGNWFRSYLSGRQQMCIEPTTRLPVQCSVFVIRL